MEIIDEKDWVKGDYIPAAIVDITADALAKTHGFQNEDYDEDGLGRARGQFMRAANGSQFMTQQLLQAGAPHDTETTIHCLRSDTRRFGDDVISALNTLAVPASKLNWVQDGLVHSNICNALKLKL